MKKRLMAIACLAFAGTFAFSACGGGSGEGNSGNVTTGYISVENLDLGSSFNAAYYPKNVKQQSGQIDVVILFEGTAPGWQAVADEYERLHSDAVYVKLDTNQIASTYTQNLNAEFTSNNRTWDIVQGNLSGGNSSNYCYNMQSAVYAPNAYAGGNNWVSVLTEEAYLTDKSGGNTDTYIMNSESLNTAWFYNKVAFDAAVEKGYKNAADKAEAPLTWDDLMSLCECMQAAGYENPLGISLATDSISASQFTWLLRVYGDLYYRNEYNNIVLNEGYEVDLTAENPEANTAHSVNMNSLFNTILASGGANYVGAESAKYQDFLGQFAKMKDYLLTDAGQLSFAQMREEFRAQSKGKESPQIFLDYVGSGISFSLSDKLEADFFDYPRMVSDFVDENTLVRDVGGNGGYLSIVNNGAAQNALTLDFMKFFLSPYGQTVYYNALEAGGIAPKGLTTIDNSLISVPASWQSFFNSDKISYTGLSDNNPYITYFIRSLSGEPKTSELANQIWLDFLVSGTVDAEEFGAQWQDTMMEDWKTFCDLKGWNDGCYLVPGGNTNEG